MDQREEIERLKAELEAAKAKLGRVRPTNIKVSEKGAVSVYGLSRFPVTLYANQWESLLNMADQILMFVEQNREKLARKEG